MKIALFIIYNHRYDQNIPLLDKIYEGRFSNIYHIVPFYLGTAQNVIPVYESSFQFQGYISQAYQHIKYMGFTHVFIVADDMVINPKITETNLHSFTGIDENCCFIEGLIDLSKRSIFWDHAFQALEYNPKQSGVEVLDILPTYDDAVKSFNDYNISYKNVNVKCLTESRVILFRKKKFHLFNEIFKSLLGKMPKQQEYALKYPLCGGYSDILLLTSDILPTFCQYCGAFAASRLFVEIAVPTALLLSHAKIQTLKDIKLNKSFGEWTDGYNDLIKQFDYDYKQLVCHYPTNCFYIHPIKLSTWMKNK